MHSNTIRFENCQFEMKKPDSFSFNVEFHLVAFSPTSEFPEEEWDWTDSVLYNHEKMSDAFIEKRNRLISWWRVGEMAGESGNRFNAVVERFKDKIEKARNRAWTT